MQQRETVNERSGKVTKRWITVKPDVEEFIEVIERHGVWLPSQQRFARALVGRGNSQLTMHLNDVDDEDLPVSQMGTSTEAPAVRTTVVDEQGTVVDTQVEVDDGIEAIAAQAGGIEPVASASYGSVADGCPTCGGDHSGDDHAVATAQAERQALHRGTDSAAQGLLEVDGGAVPNGADNSASGADWRSQTGTGTSELEQRRRSRTAVGARGGLDADPA